jgi:Ca-activated chloride channel family protein
MCSHTRSVLRLPLIALIVGAFVASTGPQADEVRIVGRVLRAGTDAPIASAQVLIQELNIGGLSDTSGQYALVVPRAALPMGDVHLTVQRIGYRAEQVVLRAPDDFTGDLLTIDIRLQEAVLQLDEIVVTGLQGGVARRALAQSVSYVTTARPHAPTGHPDWNREQYAHIEENDFKSVRDNPLSTFSIDVDRASYSNVRRFLVAEKRVPPVDAVQIEEMINYFSYDYAEPEGEHPVAVTTELGVAPWRPDHRLLRIGLASRPIDTEELPASNLVFLLDVSGSMTSSDKLPLVKRSMHLLVDQLRPIDRVAIVVYAGAAGLVLESTPGTRKDRIIEAIDRLEAGGSTAGGAGLRLAYRVAQESFLEGGNNRVILATDGDFNVGESSDSEMVRLIEEKRGDGTFLTVLGFGTGNLQSAKMQSLAQHGNGNYAYIDSLDEARKVLVGEMGGTLVTVAQDVKIQVEFNPAHVRAYRLIGYENRLLAAEDFNDDRKDAGELGAGHRVTALYEVVPVGVESGIDVSTVDPLRYQAPGDRSVQASSDELAFVRVRYKRPRGTESRLLERPVGTTAASASTDFTFAAAVAGFGMLLRESEHRGSISARQLLALATDGLGRDTDGYRRGFLELVRAYVSLADAPPPREGLR